MQTKKEYHEQKIKELASIALEYFIDDEDFDEFLGKLKKANIRFATSRDYDVYETEHVYVRAEAKEMAFKAWCESMQISRQHFEKDTYPKEFNDWFEETFPVEE